MPNNLAVSVTADVADLQVKRAIMSAELKAATKDLNDFAREAARSGTTDELRAGMLASADAVQKARASIALLNSEMRDTSGFKRVEEASGNTRIAQMEMMHVVRGSVDQFAAGAAPLQIFSMHIAQLAQAASFAGEGMGSLGAFMAGPWGIAVTAAVAVLGTLVSKLWDAKDAAKAMGDEAEQAVQKLYDSLRQANAATDAATEVTKKRILALGDLARANQQLAQAEDARKTIGALGGQADRIAMDSQILSLTNQKLDAQKRLNESINELGSIAAAAKIAEMQDKNSARPAKEARGGRSRSIGSSAPSADDMWRTELQDGLLAEQQAGRDTLQWSADFWRQKLALTQNGSKQQLEVRRELGRAELALAKANQQDDLAGIRQMETLHADAARNDVDLARIALQEKLANIDAEQQAGRISASRALQQKAEVNRQILQLDIDLENRLAQIKLDALREARAKFQVGTQQYRDYTRQIEVIEAQHQQALQQLSAQTRQREIADERAVQAERLRNIRALSTTWAQSLSGMLTGQISFANGVKAMWQGLVNVIANALTNVIQRWLEQQIAALILGRATQAATGTAMVTSNAAVAASGAYAATAVIPIIGPALAPEAAATAFAGAMTFAPLASAEGGDWNVRAGLYRLHAQEMVLPAWAASPLRAMIQAGTGMSTPAPANDGTGIEIHVHAVDAQGVKRMLLDNRGHVANALRKYARDGGR